MWYPSHKLAKNFFPIQEWTNTSPKHVLNKTKHNTLNPVTRIWTRQMLGTLGYSIAWTTGHRITILSHPSFLLPSWRAVWSYRLHLEKRDPIWGNDWSSSWGFPGFSTDLRQMPGDLCTAPGIISLSCPHYSFTSTAAFSANSEAYSAVPDLSHSLHLAYWLL